MLIAADYPFLDVLWTMILFFAWLSWLWIAVTCITDIFRRDDTSGWGKAFWVVVIIVLPFLGVLVYLIANHDGMRERGIKRAQQERGVFDTYVRQTAGGPATEIARGKELLDTGALNQSEFDALKRRTLA